MNLSKWNLADYALKNAGEILTPALCIYPDRVDQNIEAALRLMGDRSDRWRPHVKTAKLAFTIRRYLSFGIHQFKCANTLELKMLCELGVQDVLLAQPIAGSTCARVKQLAEAFPQVKVSVLVESPEHIQQWRDSGVEIFLDLNPGMDRTGVPAHERSRILELATLASGAGQQFAGIHFYDGHLGHLPFDERRHAAYALYSNLCETIHQLEHQGIAIKELITSGTPTFLAGLQYPGFAGQHFLHRVSPGTIIYCDSRSLSQLPADSGFAPAVLVLSTVVSHPSDRIVTSDAGSKSVSADAGTPTCEALGSVLLNPMKPSEEHLPFECSSALPAIGSLLYLLPSHVCTTVNNFNDAWICQGRQAIEQEIVTARGHQH